MANSQIIGQIKNRIIREFIKDKTILDAIGSNRDIKPEQYINTHIFNYNQNPYTLNTVETFITIQVHIPHSFDSNKVYVSPTVEIWIISHERHMIVDNVPKIVDNRNDYISKLIDVKLNGKSGFGIGELRLASNDEGAFQKNYLFRKMIFECKDLNKSLCGDE